MSTRSYRKRFRNRPCVEHGDRDFHVILVIDRAGAH